MSSTVGDTHFKLRFNKQVLGNRLKQDAAAKSLASSTITDKNSKMSPYLMLCTELEKYPRSEFGQPDYSSISCNDSLLNPHFSWRWNMRDRV
jgi:dolichyl-phosphate-mannose--protein O-mannosyl transferase